MPRSMTGFARQEVQHSWGSLSCEIRSVNHRYLEPSIRLPEALRSIESNLREQLRKKLSRGKVEATFFLKTEDSVDAQLALNETLASTIIKLAESVQSQLSKPADINAIDVLRWPGVIKAAKIDTDELNSVTKSLFSETLNQLISNREREGKELGLLIEDRLTSIGKAVVDVRANMPALLELQQQKIRTKIETLKIEVDEERFSQEVIYITQKSDVAEELDRLETHLVEVRHTLEQTGPIGRRLDFLMQELNREANTLSSKSLASDTTQSAVDIKVLIEQMREQVQNIE